MRVEQFGEEKKASNNEACPRHNQWSTILYEEQKKLMSPALD